ncbi:MAG: flagellar biosynthesis protein FliQ [Deltaproteobacteria bacterium]|nr:flagellar biosynthesis protein FliQ [Deltaproteobacteria bacterium]
MTPEFVTTMGKEAMEVTLLVSAPMLGVAIVVGLAVSIFQAVTQIQEMTLTFVPKIVAVFVALLLFFPWMLQIMLNFTNQIFVNIPNYIR